MKWKNPSFAKRLIGRSFIKVKGNLIKGETNEWSQSIGRNTKRCLYINF